MASKQKCVKCGETKEVRNGKFCPRGHFVCARDAQGGLITPGRTECPVCKGRLS